MAYLPRIVDQVITRRLASAGAVLIEGPKACGKSFTAEQHCASSVYLDRDLQALEALTVDPSLVLSGAAPQLVDEWQLDATRVWNYVRHQVDDRRLPGQFVLTGSAVPVDDARRHTGAGRFARVSMRPMSLSESGDSTGVMSLAGMLAGQRPTGERTQHTVADIADLVVRGGWPLNIGLGIEEAAQANVDYLRTIAEVDLSRVDAARRDRRIAERLLGALARNIAMEQKVARLANEAQGDDQPLARSTAYDYLATLQRLLILEEQPAWAPHLRSRATLRKAPRTHFTDPSLAVASLGASPKRLLRDLELLGLLFESMAVRDMRVYAEPLGARVSHYRDSDGLEVDIVVQTRDDAWGAFEVKLGSGRLDDAARNLVAFAAKVDTTRVGAPAVLGIITATGYGYARDDGVMVIPIGALGP